jgi:branched-subunit amino acid transport protein
MANIGMIIAAALATYGTRLAGFGLSQRTIPPLVNRFLTYVPVAVFAALIAPELGLSNDQWPARLLGIAAASLAVWKSRQLWAGLVAGMVVFWLVRGI